MTSAPASPHDDEPRANALNLLSCNILAGGSVRRRFVFGEDLATVVEAGDFVA